MTRHRGEIGSLGMLLGLQWILLAVAAQGWPAGRPALLLGASAVSGLCFWGVWRLRRSAPPPPGKGED